MYSTIHCSYVQDNEYYEVWRATCTKDRCNIMDPRYSTTVQRSTELFCFCNNIILMILIFLTIFLKFIFPNILIFCPLYLTILHYLHTQSLYYKHYNFNNCVFYYIYFFQSLGGVNVTSPPLLV